MVGEGGADGGGGAGGASACREAGGGGGGSTLTAKFPGTEAGAKDLLSTFLKQGNDNVALTLALKPSSADYRAVFATEELAAAAEKTYESLWSAVPKMPIGPKEGQTELSMLSALTDELKTGAGNSREFPGGYKQASEWLKPGLRVYRWKFLKPGERLGMAFDGLYHVNGHWVLMPKPWRIKGPKA